MNFHLLSLLSLILSNSLLLSTITHMSFSRKMEIEADYLGLILMARAGYDPFTAFAFWERFSKIHGENDSYIASWFSTHPSDKERILELKKHKEEAWKEYEIAQMRPLSRTPKNTITSY